MRLLLPGLVLVTLAGWAAGYLGCAGDSTTVDAHACTTNAQCGADEACAYGHCLAVRCTDDAQCERGRTCQGGSCDWDGGLCTSDSECATALGRVCAAGVCGLPAAWECEFDTQCARGLACLQGKCASSGLVGCRRDDSCGVGRICDANLGRCVPAPGGCESNADCATSEVGPSCVAGRCVGCTLDSQCPPDLICAGEQCMPPCCDSNDACRYGRVCRECACGAAPTCADGSEACAADAPCPAGQVCHSAARDHGAETRLAPERVIQGGLPGQEAV